MKNAIQHIEWTTRDPRRLRSFFGQVFDWTFIDAMPGYTLIEGIGGIFEAPDPQMPLGITPYVNVADLEATEKAIERAGGLIHKSGQEVPGMGRFTIFSDPDGTLLALWQPMQMANARAAPKRKTASKKVAAKKVAKKAVPKKTKAKKRR
ncbi:MAG TPA: VOC family protein [Solimonas sp.]|nr:VOC family protein [Solimonas sp.]